MSQCTRTFSGEVDVVNTLLLFSTVTPKEGLKDKGCAEGVAEHPMEPTSPLCDARSALVGREKRSRNFSHVTTAGGDVQSRPSKVGKSSTGAVATSLVVEPSDQRACSLSEPSSSVLCAASGGPMSTTTTGPASGATSPASSDAAQPGEDKKKVTRWSKAMDNVLGSVAKSFERCNDNGVNNDLLSSSLASYDTSADASTDGDETSVSCSHSSTTSTTGGSDHDITKSPYDWKDIAIVVQERSGIQVTSDQCWQRFIRYLDPSLNNFANRKKPWTDKEDQQLEIIIEKSMFQGQRGGINWSEVCRLTQRPYVECRSRQRSLSNRCLSKGPFTAADDDNILALLETGHSYVSAGKVTRRTARSVRERYRYLIGILHLDKLDEREEW